MVVFLPLSVPTSTCPNHMSLLSLFFHHCFTSLKIFSCTRIKRQTEDYKGEGQRRKKSVSNQSGRERDRERERERETGRATGGYSEREGGRDRQPDRDSEREKHGRRLGAEFGG